MFDATEEFGELSDTLRRLEAAEARVEKAERENREMRWVVEAVKAFVSEWFGTAPDDGICCDANGDIDECATGLHRILSTAPPYQCPGCADLKIRMAAAERSAEMERTAANFATKRIRDVSSRMNRIKEVAPALSTFSYPSPDSHAHNAAVEAISEALSTAPLYQCPDCADLKSRLAGLDEDYSKLLLAHQGVQAVLEQAEDQNNRLKSLAKTVIYHATSLDLAATDPGTSTVFFDAINDLRKEIQDAS